MNNRDRVIVALDFPTADEAVRMAQKIAPIFPYFKIGSKLFTQAGPPLVKEVLKHGKVFLDLKYFDIPSVVADAVLQATELGVSLVTLHASGGSEMMRSSKEKIASLSGRPKLLGVTVLTSFSDLSEFGIKRSIPEQVEFLAALAQTSGMDGIVCSPAELPELRPKFKDLLMVTPGIRGADDDRGDQKRTASPQAALQSGADFLVIGRPIIASPDPVASAGKIADSIQ
jgi:orotidine-5'-phosphate decarboxylase